MKATLMKRIREAKDTESFIFKPDKPVKYLPGQFFYFTLLSFAGKDERGLTRQFTLSSSPTEGDNIVFTTRLRKESEFKQNLFKLQKGDELEAYGPNGTFILDENEKGPHVLLAGGIGITPFRSILKYHVDKKLNTKFHLIYSNKTPELIAFRDELEKLSKNNNNLKLTMAITRPEKSKKSWKGLTGRVDEKFLRSNTSDLKSQTYWIVGPPPMVDAMEAMLERLKIPSKKIRTEKFTGY